MWLQWWGVEQGQNVPRAPKEVLETPLIKPQGEQAWPLGPKAVCGGACGDFLLSIVTPILTAGPNPGLCFLFPKAMILPHKLINQNHR